MGLIDSHAPHFAAVALGLHPVTVHACDYAAGPQKFSRRNVECEVFHPDLFAKDSEIATAEVKKLHAVGTSRETSIA